jgi:hypothetical protein
MERRSKRTPAIFRFHEFLTKEKHEDQQRSDEPMQAHGNSVISGSCGNRHGSNPVQRGSAMDRRARPQFPLIMVKFLDRTIDVNQDPLLFHPA